jgi:uncharacterized protein (TIRG00374 family)
MNTGESPGFSRGRRFKVSMKKLRNWIGIIISLITLVWALQGIRLVDVWTALQKVNYLYLIPASFFVIVTLVGRAVRWRLLFSPTPLQNLLRFFFIINVGYLVNNLLPLRAGDLVRGLMISKAERVSKVRALSTVLLEHVMDIMILVLLLVLVIQYLPSQPAVVLQAGKVIGVAVLGVMLILGVLSYQKKRALTALSHLLSLANSSKNKQLYRRAESFLDFLHSLKSSQIYLELAGLSLLLWFSAILLAYSLFIAFGLQLPFIAAVFVICIVSLGIAVPSSPGYIGVYHSLVVFALTVYSVDKSLAFSYALVLHGWQYILIMILGVFSLWKESISFSSLNKVAAEEKEAN